MKFVYFIATFSLLGFVALPESGICAEASAQPDNTVMNKADRADGAVTADQQNSNPTDMATTKAIRQELMKSNLSSYAHNVKIVTTNGMVTVKGPVRSEREERAVVAIAQATPGVTQVVNELTVKSKSSKTRTTSPQNDSGTRY
jgi:osmotically-inducible protein OsmY